MNFEDLYKENYAIVFGYLLSLCNNADIAEELTADVFLKAFEKISTYAGKSKISTWLCGIAKNEYLQYLRKNRHHLSFEELNDVADNNNFENDLQDRNTAVLLHKCLHNLPEPYHEVFILHVFAELNYKEIADIMNISARVIFFRAKNMIKKEMEEKYE